MDTRIYFDWCNFHWLYPKIYNVCLAELAPNLVEVGGNFVWARLGPFFPNFFKVSEETGGLAVSFHLVIGGKLCNIER